MKRDRKMKDDVTLLPNSVVKGNISERELSFQKEVWESKKHRWLISWYVAKYDYKLAKMDVAQQRVVLNTLKDDHDTTIINYKDEKDEGLK